MWGANRANAIVKTAEINLSKQSLYLFICFAAITVPAIAGAAPIRDATMGANKGRNGKMPPRIRPYPALRLVRKFRVRNLLSDLYLL